VAIRDGQVSSKFAASAKRSSPHRS